MAKETYTKLIDDLDGTEAQETVNFALDGYSYEIDLSAKNANKLRNALSPYLEAGTRMGRTVVSSRGGGSRAKAGAVVERDLNKAIRAWALKKGLDVAPRGRIRQDVIDQYHREAR